MATRKITEIKDNATGDINQMRDNDIINNVPSTTSSDAAITTSVPLVAEDGSIVKIKRDSFVEAIASVFAANNQTTFSKLFGVNGTTPMGIEPSALASVLGVYNKQGGYPDSYFSSLVNPGTYHTYGDLCVVFKDDDTVAQLLFQLESSGDLVRIVARIKDGNKDWSSWKNLYRSTF